MTYLEHVTITTGASRRSPRSEVDDHVVTRLRTSLAGDGQLWAGWSGRLLPTAPGGYVFELSHRARLIVMCWLCEDEAVAADLWSAATASGLDPHARLARPARTPWLAASLSPGALDIARTEPSVLVEAGDVERCVAWAILE